MTAMSSNTRELDISQLILRGAQMAGIMALEQSADSGSAQWLAKASFGRDQLEAIIKSLPNQSLLTRNIALDAISLTSGTASYAQAAGTIGINGRAMYAPSGSSIQYPVQQIDREEYQAIADKTVASIPSRFWVERRATVTVYLWPVPNDTGATLTVQRERYLADSSDGNATPDAEPAWMDYLLKELAYRFSVGMPVSERALLRSDAQTAYERAAAAVGKQNVANHIELYHPTGWN